ncbi:MAG: ribosome small subunit-dependent GTPase A [Spirochaetota bacterium]
MTEKKLIEGRITKIYGTVYFVEYKEEIYSCRLRGKLKLLQSTTDMKDPKMKEKLKLLKSTNTKNPLAVGDFVKFKAMESEEIGEEGYKQGLIYELIPRRNKLSRSFVQHKKVKEQFIAANVDYVLCVNSVKSPRLKTSFIDRVIVTCEKEEIEPIIIVNKIDLEKSNATINKKSYGEEKVNQASKTVKEIYEPLGYKILFTSAKTKKGMDELKALIKNKVVVLTGYSGVGKSTIINSLIGKEIQRVREVSRYSDKGKHTTTTSEIIEIQNGGYIIDTPGLSEFGIYNIDKDDLYHYFRELEPYTGKCKYTPCTHSHEPDCAVKEDVNNGIINNKRYENYLKILNTLEEIS